MRSESTSKQAKRTREAQALAARDRTAPPVTAPSVTAPSVTAPEEALEALRRDALRALAAEIVTDASTRPERYQREVLVPYGGE